MQWQLEPSYPQLRYMRRRRPHEAWSPAIRSLWSRHVTARAALTRRPPHVTRVPLCSRVTETTTTLCLVDATRPHVPRSITDNVTKNPDIFDSTRYVSYRSMILVTYCQFCNVNVWASWRNYCFWLVWDISSPRCYWMSVGVTRVWDMCQCDINMRWWTGSQVRYLHKILTSVSLIFNEIHIFQDPVESHIIFPSPSLKFQLTGELVEKKYL